MKQRRQTGFTIIEILIVIVIIGILAALVLSTFASAREKAQSAAIADGLRKVDESFLLWSAEEGFDTWPEEPTGGGGTALVDFIDETTLNEYLPQVPQVDGLDLEDWFYDNEGDWKPECGDNYDGVNIVIRFLENDNIGQRVDDILDDGNLNCGKVRYVDQRIFYSLDYDQTAS